MWYSVPALPRSVGFGPVSSPPRFARTEQLSTEPASTERTPGEGASRGPGHLLVGLGRGQEAEAGMPAPAVVEGFHLLEDRPPGRLPRREGRAVDELVLQAAEEALHRRVIEAIALAAHGLRDPVPGEDRPVGLARVLPGLNRSSQHQPDRIAARRREPRQAFANRASCAVCR